ncbi:MAG TPA: LysR family transcriptional regulator [Thermoleophilaceae bacterium]|nr:LysR family transcriptional regulator [Thermoleophilaceae bacterium]
MRIDPRRLLTLHAVARHGSFSRAAEELTLTQSAVSQQVAALERQLGVQLLQRGRGGVRPTPAGETLLAHAAALEERLQLAGTQLAELAHEERRKLRVGAAPSALATIVPDAAAALVVRTPDLEVQLTEGRLDELVTGVRDGDLHLAVCFQDAAVPRREHPGTRRHDLADEPMVVAVSPRHRLARRKQIRLAELAGDAWTAPSRDGLIVRACRAAGFEPSLNIISGDPLAIRAVVRAGLAVTMTPRLLAAQLHGVRILTVDDPPRRDLYALLPDAGARATEQAFLEELKQAT